MELMRSLSQFASPPPAHISACYTHSILVPHKRQNNNEKPEAAAAAAAEAEAVERETGTEARAKSKKKNLSHIFCCALFAFSPSHTHSVCSCSLRCLFPSLSVLRSPSFWTIHGSRTLDVSHTRALFVILAAFQFRL